MKSFKLKHSVKTYPTLYPSTSGIGPGIAADLNRDGKIDIVYSIFVTNTNNPVDTPIGIFSNTGKVFKPFQLTIDGVKNQWPTVKFGIETLIYDLNSDKIPDIIPLDQSEVKGTKGTFEGNYQFAYISTGIGKYQKVQIGNDKYNVHGHGIIESADKQIRIVFNTPWTENFLGPSGVKTVISMYDKKSKKFQTEFYTGEDIFYSKLHDQWKDFFYQTTIDINNDGNTDIVNFSSESGKNFVYLNNGHGKFSFYREISTGLTPQIKVSAVTVGDYNGDGLQDMFILGVNFASTNYDKTLRVLINKNGKTFEDKTDQFLNGGYQNISSSDGPLKSLDINKDGLTDVVWNHNSNYNHTSDWNFDVFVSHKNEFKVNTLKNVVDAGVIPLNNNSLYDGNKIISLETAAIETKKAIKSFTWLPGELDDYVITKGNGYNIFTSESDQYWISNTKKNINFDDYSIQLSESNNIIGQPTLLPSEWGHFL